MAYFDVDELSDCVRSVFAQEDSTGLSCKVLERPRRKMKPGGLLINFQKCPEDSDFENEIHYSPYFMPKINEEFFCKESTSAAITSGLTSQLCAVKEEHVFNCSEQRPITQSLNNKNYFVKKDFDDNLPTTSSMVSRFIKEKPIGSSCGFDEYAKFEAMEGLIGAKKMTIVFPFCKPSPCSIIISIIGSATLSDLIGLSCYVYTRESRVPPCDNPSSYSLYLAEENLEYDTELPPQDRHRLVAECGFPVLALVKNSEVLQNQRYFVNVYFVNGKFTTFELESLDIQLQWLFDEALKRREKKISPLKTNKRNLFREFEYVLETIEKKDCSLKLTNTISSTGCTNFVLLRKNSSRGEYFDTNIGSKFLSVNSSLSYLNNPNFEFKSRSNSQINNKSFSTTISTKTNAGSAIKKLMSEREKKEINLNSKLLARSADNNLGGIIEECLVDRLHKIKPKWPAKFLIRENGIEIVAVQIIEKRKSFALKGSQKNSQILWEFIGSIEVNPSERGNARRVIKIIYLLVPEVYHNLFTEHDLNLDSKDKSYLIKAYEQSVWKTLQIESGNDESWNIGVKLPRILDSKRSHVQRVYDHSVNGTKKPLLAIETALNLESISQLTKKTILNKKCVTPTKNIKLNTKLNVSGVANEANISSFPGTKAKADNSKISTFFSRMFSKQD